MLKIELIDKTMPLPKYQTEGSAGIDLYVKEQIDLMPFQKGFFSTNIKMDIPKGYFVSIKSRSSSFKDGLFIFEGTIDSDYKKEIMVGIQNTNPSPKIIDRGQRIAQAIIMKYEQMKITEETVQDNERGGFGSTGK